MANMTWNQFKEHVDTLLKEQEISADEEVWYVDISFPKADKVGVDDGGIDCPSVVLGDCGIQVS